MSSGPFSGSDGVPPSGGQPLDHADERALVSLLRRLPELPIEPPGHGPTMPASCESIFAESIFAESSLESVPIRLRPVAAPRELDDRVAARLGIRIATATRLLHLRRSLVVGAGLLAASIVCLVAAGLSGPASSGTQPRRFFVISDVTEPVSPIANELDPTALFRINAVLPTRQLPTRTGNPAGDGRRRR